MSNEFTESKSGDRFQNPMDRQGANHWGREGAAPFLTAVNGSPPTRSSSIRASSSRRRASSRAEAGLSVLTAVKTVLAAAPDHLPSNSARGGRRQ